MIAGMSIEAVARRAAKEAIREALPALFSPRGYERIAVHPSKVRPGDIPLDENGQMWGHGRVLQLLEWLDDNGSTNPEDWERRYLIQSEGFVPLVELPGQSSGGLVEVFRPLAPRAA